MKLISSEYIKAKTGVKNQQLLKLIMSSMKIGKINQLYSSLPKNNEKEFLSKLISDLNINIELDPSDLANIPSEGQFFTVSNHPFGGWDALLLLHVIKSVRNDFVLLGDSVLTKILPLKSSVLKRNFDKSSGVVASSEINLKMINNNNPIGFFPSLDVSNFNSVKKRFTDSRWDSSIIRTIKNGNVPVIPIYFEGKNSIVFNTLGLIHPSLNSAFVGSEFLKKKNQTIKLRIGKPISVKEQNEFSGVNEFGRYLRARTYCLGTQNDPVKFYFPKVLKYKKPLRIIKAINSTKIVSEIEEITENSLLFKVKQFEVFCASSSEIPNILREIGRLREVTFRTIGEGSNKSVDLDQYDLYYKHLFIWDTEQKNIVGAYRVGQGDMIYNRYGKQGFYINSLFKIKKSFNPVLQNGLELGRSFIRNEYQKNPIALFLLWKGILYYLLKNEQYRFLFGPASISNQFPAASRSLIVDFIKSNYFNENLSKSVKPRKKFSSSSFYKEIDYKGFNSKNPKHIESLMQSMEPKFFKIPVLIKKYIKQNAKFIGFNVDPKFNKALDGFIVLDLFEVSDSTILSLSKEMNDESILKRFELTNQ